MKKYWFYLEPHVYVEFKTEKILVYCTKTGAHLEIEELHCRSIIENIYKDENLGVVEISEDQAMNTNLQCMIDYLTTHGMGNLVPVVDPDEKPVILLPLLSLNKDLDRMKDEEMREMIAGTDICKYLLGVTIIVNNECHLKCRHCGLSCNQFMCCQSDKDAVKELDRELLVSVLSQLSYMPTKTINIIGGDVYKFCHLDVLSKITEKKILNVWTNYKNYQPDSTIDQCRIHLLVDFPFDKNKFAAVTEETKGKDTTYHFIVDNEEQLEDSLSNVSHFRIANYKIHPYYNGANVDFFDKKVFMDKDDIFSSIHSMREILRNKKLNANYFGELYIFPDGEVRAERNTEALGNIKEADIKTMIQRELIENTAWRKTRTHTPCSECICQNLCPSPIYYEIVTNKKCCGIKTDSEESLLSNFNNNNYEEKFN